MDGLSNAIGVLEEAKAKRFSDKLQSIMDKMNAGAGYQKKSTRPKEGQMYTITDKGLVPVKTGVLKIQANQVYSMGASYSPKWVYITKAPDKDGIFYYKDYPFARSKERKGTLKYLEDLIVDGTRRELKNLQGSQFQTSGTRDRISRIKALLANKKTRPKKLSDFDEFEVSVVSADGKDHWRTAERYGNVMGLKDVDGKPAYGITEMRRTDLVLLKRDKRLSIVSIKKVT